MNFFNLKEKMAELPCFETNELKLVLGRDFSDAMFVNLKNWVKKEHLIMLRRGLYVFSEKAKEADVMVFATKIYPPSYVSLETALSFYGIIPEAVFVTTSVTTRKTQNFQTPLGSFSYQKIKKEVFGGFEPQKSGAFFFNLALPEKALVDLFYLKRNILDGTEEQFSSYRFNKDFKFDIKRLKLFSEKFQNKKVSFLTQSFIQYYVAS